MKVKKSNKRLCEGDKVIVIAGNDKGKTGTILSRKGDDKFIVQGVNIRKKHVKPTQEGKGNIIEIETPIHGSNIMLSPIEGKGVKLKVNSDKDQRQYVYNDDKGQEVVYRAANKKAK